MNYQEIREYFHKQKGSLLDVRLQAEGQFSCSVIPSSRYFDLGKNNRKLCVWDVVEAEIDIRAAGKVHGYSEGQGRAET